MAAVWSRCGRGGLRRHHKRVMGALQPCVRGASLPHQPTLIPYSRPAPAMPLRPIFAALFFILLLAGAVRAGDRALFYARNGVAISGYDTVAYFVSGAAVPGRPDIAVMWRGAVWRFATRRNREVFEANPRAYAPQYGGYCAYGVAQGHAMGSDPLAWHIVDGKLYLIHNPDLLKAWLADPVGFIARSEANWPAALFR